MLQRIWLNTSKLTKEITLTLIIKIIALLTIWYFFFSHPVDEDLTQEHLRNQILGAIHSPSSHQNNTSTNIFPDRIV